MADCKKCGGTHIGDVQDNCPLSADYVPSKPWPKVGEKPSAAAMRAARQWLLEMVVRGHDKPRDRFLHSFYAAGSDEQMRQDGGNNTYGKAILDDFTNTVTLGEVAKWMAEFAEASGSQPAAPPQLKADLEAILSELDTGYLSQTKARITAHVTDMLQRYCVAAPQKQETTK